MLIATTPDLPVVSIEFVLLDKAGYLTNILQQIKEQYLAYYGHNNEEKIYHTCKMQRATVHISSTSEGWIANADPLIPDETGINLPTLST